MAFELKDIQIPSLTSTIAGLIAYFSATRETTRRIAAEKRAEYVSQFIGQAYANLQYLFSAKSTEGAGSVMPGFAVLGRQAAFFLSDESGIAIDNLTSKFIVALTNKTDDDPRVRAKAWEEYKTEVDQLCKRLRRELQATP